MGDNRHELELGIGFILPREQKRLIVMIDRDKGSKDLVVRSDKWSRQVGRHSSLKLSVYSYPGARRWEMV